MRKDESSIEGRGRNEELRQDEATCRDMKANTPRKWNGEGGNTLWVNEENMMGSLELKRWTTRQKTTERVGNENGRRREKMLEKLGLKR